jgi:enoyl-CoA hydratase
MARRRRTAASEPLVRLEKEGRGLARILLNRPKKLNALSLEMMEQFGQCLDAIQYDDEISVVIITGEGKAFSVGADLEFLHELGAPEDFRKALFQYWHRHFDAIENMEKLFVAALNGIALGGALEMALVCDLRIAAEGIKVAMPQIKYGLLPDSGGTNRLAKLIGRSVTKEFILSGESIDSQEALRIGLVDRVFPAQDFLNHAYRYVEKFLDKSSSAIGLGKLAVNRGEELNSKEGLVDAALFQSILLNSDPYKRAIKHFERKRDSDNSKSKV